MAEVAPRRYNTRSRSKPEAGAEDEPVVVAPKTTRARRTAATSSTATARKSAPAPTTTTSTTTRRRAVATTAMTATRTARRTTASTPAEKASTKRAASSDAPRRPVKRATPPEREREVSIIAVEVAIPVRRPARARASSTTKKSPKKSPRVVRVKKKVTFQSPSQHEVNKENNGPKAPSTGEPKKSILTSSSVNVLPPASPPKRATTPKLDLEEDDDLNVEPLLNSPHRRPRAEPLFGASINLSPARNAPPVRPVSPARINQNLSSIPSLAPFSSSLAQNSPVRPSPVRQFQSSKPFLEDANDGLDMEASSSLAMPVRPTSGFTFSSPKKYTMPSKTEREAARNTPARRPPQTPGRTPANTISKTPLFARSTPAPAAASVRATPARRPAIPQGFATNLPAKKERDAPAGSLSVSGPVRLKLPQAAKVPKLDLSSFVPDNLFDVPKTPRNAPLFTPKDKSSKKTPSRSPLLDMVNKAAEADVTEDGSEENNESGSEPGTPTFNLSSRLFDFNASPKNSPVPSPTEESPSPVETDVEKPIGELSAEETPVDSSQETQAETSQETDADGDSQMMDSPEVTPNNSFNASFALAPLVSPTPTPKPKTEIPKEQAPASASRGYGLPDLDVEDSSNDTISTLRDSGAYLLAPITGQLEDFHLSLNIFSPTKPVAQRPDAEDNSATPRASQQTFSTPTKKLSLEIPIDPALLEEADRIEQEESNGFTTVPVKFSPNSSFSSDQENKMPSSPESIADGIIPRVEMSRGRTPRRDRTSTAPGILAGAVVFVDVHLVEGENVRTRFVNMLTELGAKIVKRWDWNPSDGGKVGITHVVFKEGSPKTLQRVRATDVVQCVGLNWVNECYKEQRWLDESDYAVDTECVPRGGGRRRKSMEPKLYHAMNSTPAPAPIKAPATIAHPSSSNLFSNLSFLPADITDAESSSIPEAPEPPSFSEIHDDYDFDQENQENNNNQENAPAPVKIAIAPATPVRRVDFAIPKTCPPQKAEDQSGVSELLRERLNFARRKSLQFKPKIGSPLSRTWIPRELA